MKGIFAGLAIAAMVSSGFVQADEYKNVLDKDEFAGSCTYSMADRDPMLAMFKMTAKNQAEFKKARQWTADQYATTCECFAEQSNRRLQGVSAGGVSIYASAAQSVLRSGNIKFLPIELWGVYNETAAHCDSVMADQAYDEAESKAKASGNKERLEMLDFQRRFR